MTDICGTCGLPKFTDMVQMQAEIERLKAELEAETQRRWEGNRIASSEAAEELADVKKYWAEAHTATHTKLATSQAERDAAIKEIGKWAREAGASQAREAKLRELLTQFELWESYDDPETPIKDALARIGSDDTALKEAIKQGQREILLKAADFGTAIDDRGVLKFELRKMAEELK